ncbi:nucleolar protein 6 [Meleagris gallopavo]|uniref:nucleolar protein 6 n=1 Tax=Meleagris gallopavo TaxID=9103 RepID=UPI000549D00F|nr:nucleolar protein 6 [Meleagris gallopavo]
MATQQSSAKAMLQPRLSGNGQKVVSTAGLDTCQWSISPIYLPFLDADCTEIKNKFVAARSHLPVMFIATPKDKWNSIWTQERPSAQILQRLLVLASESVRALEEQLMDPLSSQDVKVIPWGTT